MIVMPPTVSSRSITVNWNEIPCLQRNGMIIRYEVEFGPSGGVTTSVISERSFTANELTPFTNYTFQVLGVNSVASGPYSNLIIITTSEAGNFIELYTPSMYVCSLCFYIIHSSAPGPVFRPRGTSTLAMVVLTWDSPRQPNGIITQYMVTYRVNGSTPVTRNINDPDTTTFNITSLFPQTTISNISVTASTSAGPGPETPLEDVVTLTRPREYQ